jgi:hypothetical protein
MPLGKRSILLGVMCALAIALYGAARFYSPPLILFVVEQALIQKAPPGTDGALVHEQLCAFLAAVPTQDAKMAKLYKISEYLEKVQSLTLEDLNTILKQQ